MAVRLLLGLLLVVSSVFATTAAAQEARGTIQGRVLDASGAAVPGEIVFVLFMERVFL
jgi:hypothetical protein